jgi:6-phosphofructokinase 1
MRFDNVVGNLIIGQSGGPTPVINASLAGALAQLQAQGFSGRIFGMSGGLEQFMTGREPIDLSYLSDAQIQQLAHTSGGALGSCRVKLEPDSYKVILSLFKRYDIHYLLYIGGNGSMRTPLALSQAAETENYQLYCVGIPKTIDNDLVGMDHTPGYGSAARWIAQHTLDTGLDLYTMRGFDQFKVLEVMGRHCGWLAAASLLAKFRPNDPPHIVLVPEQVFDEAAFLAEVQEVYRREGCVLVVASEGVHNAGGQYLAELGLGGLGRDANGQVLLSLGSVADYLCNLVKSKLGIKARYDKPATLQRGAACVSEVDRDEAYKLGQAAADYALAGKTAVMPGLKRLSNEPYTCEIVPFNLSEIVGREKKLGAEFFVNGRLDETRVRDYVGPLIGPALPEPFRF